jgi:hypothetical protein
MLAGQIIKVAPTISGIIEGSIVSLLLTRIFEGSIVSLLLTSKSAIIITVFPNPILL